MPSKTYYKKSKVYRSPPELIEWFDSVKDFRNDPKMNSFRLQFTAISGNSDPDWSLFRAKLRGDVGMSKDEALFVMHFTRITRKNGRPLFGGLGSQMDLLQIVGTVRPKVFQNE